MNATLNLGRAQVLRAVAKWLDANPTLPIASVEFTSNGRIDITPARSGEDYSDAAEIHGLFALARQVGATVELVPVARTRPYGWFITATWTSGVVPMSARVRVSEIATDVRVLPTNKAAARKAS